MAPLFFASVFTRSAGRPVLRCRFLSPIRRKVRRARGDTALPRRVRARAKCRFLVNFRVYTSYDTYPRAMVSPPLRQPPSPHTPRACKAKQLPKVPLSSHSSPAHRLRQSPLAFLLVIYCAVALAQRLRCRRVRAKYSAASLQQQHKHASHAPRAMDARPAADHHGPASARNKTSAAHPTARHARQHRAELRRESPQNGPEQRRDLGVRGHERRVDLAAHGHSIEAGPAAGRVHRGPRRVGCAKSSWTAPASTRQK